MSTSYPATLPTVPGDQWNADRPNGYAYDEITDDENIVRFNRQRVEIDAADSAEAELRTLAYIDGSFQDDIRGASATAGHEITTGRWAVDIDIPVHY